MSDAKPIVWKPAAYLAMYPRLLATALRYGYCLAVHGSMNRDFDLVAVPWTEDAEAAEVLIQKIAEEIGGKVPTLITLADGSIDDNPQKKPHGRLGYTIHLDCGMYLDVSVMPPPSSNPPCESRT